MCTRTVAILLAALLMLACAPASRPLIAGSGSNPPLGDTHWVLQELGTSAVAKTPPVTLNFGPDNRIGGNDGCNQYFAAYTLDGPSMRIGAAGATRRFCAEPDGMMNQERLYLEALQTTATFRLDGNRLELRTANGSLAASFRRVAGE